MREMKDSGIAWIGKIPKEWGIVKFKYLHNGLNTGEAIDKEYWESDAGLNAFYTAGLTPIRTGYSNFPTWKETGENDLLLARNGTPYVYLPVSKAYYTDHIIRAAMSSLVNRRFIRYCLQQSIASIAVDSVSIPTWSATLWNNQILTWPSVIEQERIAAFLDAQCAEIDTVSEKTRASIEEYKKLKQAVITQAVTKGVRGDRPMKDSGIEWIGTCPLNWTVCRIKNVIFPQEKEVLPDDEIITCFRDGEVTLRKNRREDGFTVSFTEHGYHGVDKGDLVIHGMDAFAGAIGCSDSRGKTTPVVHTCKTAGNNRFFMYFLRSMAYGNILMDLSNGVRIRSSDFRNFAKLGVFGAVMPPLKEQDEIVDYIDEIVIQMDHLIQKKENLLTEIENYKKSLIYEYVTGKKEVV